MLILFIFIILIIVGILISNNIYYEDVGASLTAVGILMTVLLLASIFISNVNSELRFQQDMLEHDILQKQVNTESNEYIIKDIIEYNRKVLVYKERGESPWVGAFYYIGAEDLPYIEMDN